MNKSRWIAARANEETVVLESEPGAWHVLWCGELCTPIYNSRGAAEAGLAMYQRGQRKPEVVGDVPRCPKCGFLHDPFHPCFENGAER